MVLIASKGRKNILWRTVSKFTIFVHNSSTDSPNAAKTMPKDIFPLSEVLRGGAVWGKLA